MKVPESKQTDRQTKAHLFLPPPLSHLFGFVLFSATVLFCCSVSEMRHKTLRFVVCLPLTAALLYRTHSTPLSPLFLPGSSQIRVPVSSLSTLLRPAPCSLYTSAFLPDPFPLYHRGQQLIPLALSPSFPLSFLPCSIHLGHSMIRTYFCLQQQPACDVDLCWNKHCRIIFPLLSWQRSMCLDGWLSRVWMIGARGVRQSVSLLWICVHVQPLFVLALFCVSLGYLFVCLFVLNSAKLFHTTQCIYFLINHSYWLYNYTCSFFGNTFSPFACYWP